MASVSRSVGTDGKASGFLKWAGWAGLLGTLAYILTIVMSTGGVSAPDGPADMSRFLADVADGGSLAYVYGIAGFALVVLYIPMAAGLYRMLGRSPAAWNGSAAVILGLAVLLPAYAINLLPPFVFTGLEGELGSDGATALFANYAIAEGLAELFFAVGSVLSLSVGPFLWGVAWLQSEDRSRWIGWAGIVTGLTGLVWVVWLAAPDSSAILLIANVLVGLVLFTSASVVLIRRGRAGG